MNFNQNTFMESVYQEAIENQKQFTDKEKNRNHIRNGLAASLGPFPFVSEIIKNSQPVLIEQKEFGGYFRERFIFHAAENLEIPIYVLTPKNRKTQQAAVLALHGHGYGSREIVGLTPDGNEDIEEPGIHQHFAVQLVNRGLKVFAPELSGFGDRRLSKDIAENKSSSCEAMAVQLLMAGRTLPGLRVFEAIRVIDLIESFSDVNEDQIGIMGFSGGGLVAAYAAVLDKRIKATVLTGFTNTYKGSILAINHCIDNYLPGILTYGELPDILKLIAPRHLFVEAGEEDPIFPVQHVKTAVDQLLQCYKSMQREARFSYDIFPGSHEVSGRCSYDWLSKVLKSGNG